MSLNQIKIALLALVTGACGRPRSAEPRSDHQAHDLPPPSSFSTR
jgi:hypothetical protein